MKIDKNRTRAQTRQLKPVPDPNPTIWNPLRHYSLDTSVVCMYFLNIYTRVCIKKKDREWHNSVWKPLSFYIANDEILQKVELDSRESQNCFEFLNSRFPSSQTCIHPGIHKASDGHKICPGSSKPMNAVLFHVKNLIF